MKGIRKEARRRQRVHLHEVYAFGLLRQCHNFMNCRIFDTGNDNFSAFCIQSSQLVDYLDGWQTSFHCIKMPTS